MGSSITSAVGEKVNDHVYLLHNPPQPQVELVFIHGLQFGGFRDAYWNTWVVRDQPDQCWPATWLKHKTPRARILSLSYDSSAMRSRTQGNMDLYSLGESLLPMMLSAGIGQKRCPVIFVCHSLGGLVAKQIVVQATRQVDPSTKIQAFLDNISGFFFYATPHAGSKLVDFADNIFARTFVDKGLVLDYLRVLNKDTAVLNNAFEKIYREEASYRWEISVIGETHKTTVPGLKYVYMTVVSEASARLEGFNYMSVGEDHMNVCKPREPTSASFVSLVDFIDKCIAGELVLGEILREDLR